MVTASPEYWVITAGTFFVGLGWSCINVAATAVIADSTRAHERGRAVGTNDALVSSSIVLALLAGPLVDNFGLISVGLVGAVVMLAPLPLVIRLRESSPGNYAHADIG
jgi:MFS family permease